MCHIRFFFEFDEDVFSAESASTTQIRALPGTPVLLWPRDGIFFCPTHPYLATASLWPFQAFFLSWREEIFKEQRGQRRSDKPPLSLFQEIGHPRSAFILTRDYFKAPKSPLTKSFPNIQPKFSFFLAWVTCSWLYNHLLCNPVDFLSFCIPQIHVDINVLLLILFTIY